MTQNSRRCSNFGAETPLCDHNIDDGREWFERISRNSPTAEHDGFRKIVWEIIMFSEIRKVISSGYVQKTVVGVGILTFAANVRLPNLRSHFGAAGRVPAGLARWTRFHETFATII